MYIVEYRMYIIMKMLKVCVESMAYYVSSNNEEIDAVCNNDILFTNSKHKPHNHNINWPPIIFLVLYWNPYDMFILHIF